MKGLELAKQFYLEHGEPMLKRDFPHLLPLIAVGLAGAGSECFGYDDAISQDHDFEPGFCIFLPDEDVLDRKSAFALERAYAKLPREFMGFKRSPLSPVGGNRHGVIRISDFLTEKTGTPDGVLTLRDYLHVPEESLAEATNGEVFFDGLGTFTEVRARLAYLPEDIRRKKLAGHLLMMGQSGQYNYPRCISRGETGAAQLAICEFVKSALHAIFLLNKTYLPYYKWSFRALRDLPDLAELEGPLTFLLTSDNEEGSVTEKIQAIEHITNEITSLLRAQGLSHYAGSELEGHAYETNAAIESSEIRNLHILCAV